MRYGHVKSRLLKHPTPTCFLRHNVSKSSAERCSLHSGLRAPRLDSTFGCDLGAELRKGMLVPDAAAHVPHEQRFTDGWRATCHRSAEVLWSTVKLQTTTQLCLTTSGLRLVMVSSCFELSALHHSGRASLTYPCPLGALRRTDHYVCGEARQFHVLGRPPAPPPTIPVPGACAQRVGRSRRRTRQPQTVRFALSTFLHASDLALPARLAGPISLPSLSHPVILGFVVAYASSYICWYAACWSAKS